MMPASHLPILLSLSALLLSLLFTGSLASLAVRRVPPRFIIMPPTTQEIMPGGAVNLTCAAVGSPMPYVKWKLNSEELTPEDEMPVGRNILELNSIRESANYTCVAMSSLGIIEVTSQIIVKCFRGHNCEEKVDDCPGHKCMNGGICVDGVNTYSCQCLPEWTGQYCAEDVNECLMQPNACHNGGTCFNTIGGHTCVCVNGWTGDDCSENIDDCASAACFSGATCHDRVASFFCECPVGKTGLLCHLDDACVSNPCNEGAMCDTNPLNGRFICTCPAGFVGGACNQDIDECSFGANPCEHFGKCVNTEGSFHCQCRRGYTGPRCEIDINECRSMTCQNDDTNLDRIVPGQPTNFQVGEVSDTSIELTWKPASEKEGVISYELHYREGGQESQVKKTFGPTSSYVVKGLRANTEYYFSLAAVSNKGIGAFTSETSQRTSQASGGPSPAELSVCIKMVQDILGVDSPVLAGISSGLESEAEPVEKKTQTPSPPAAARHELVQLQREVLQLLKEKLQLEIAQIKKAKGNQ
ncbi:hypothetical protein Q8A67_001450 [Cirrhinus molitorella]|uniref:protein-tyrosine-phosphatase n=1 Tax=Cirrhinus molitorella TaxID=172907 RepID=A0AA88QBI5_9TELE|nr:hypothetical protein Q8A67_001450 [Cirrhinus molitorella]